MAEPLYTLSRDDVLALRELLRQDRQRQGNTTQRPRIEEADEGAPEVYVALIPPGGIAGLSAGDLEPSFAECHVYRLIQVGAAKQLEVVTGLTRTVYNVGGSALSAGRYVLVERDKFGEWFASCQGCTIDAGTGTGTGGEGGALPTSITLSYFVGSCLGGCASGGDSVEMNLVATSPPQYLISFVPAGCSEEQVVQVVIYQNSGDPDNWYWAVNYASGGVDSGGPLAVTNEDPLAFEPFDVDWSSIGGAVPCEGIMGMLAEE